MFLSYDCFTVFHKEQKNCAVLVIYPFHKSSSKGFLVYKNNVKAKANSHVDK
jgi:hypothetical protein